MTGTIVAQDTGDVIYSIWDKRSQQFKENAAVNIAIW